MTTETKPTSTAARSVVGMVLLAAGALFGLVSVYSDSRAACALWVTVALVLTFGSGLLLRPQQLTSYRS